MLPLIAFATDKGHVFGDHVILILNKMMLSFNSFNLLNRTNRNSGLAKKYVTNLNFVLFSTSPGFFIANGKITVLGGFDLSSSVWNRDL